MLRDFVDHDLPDQLQAHVENHVHSCRTCALALARTEYEVFRLRSGFLGSWAAIGPRPGFSRRTISRLLSETATDRRLPMLPTSAARARLGIAASKKIGGSVERNLAKRRMREVFRVAGLPAPLDVVVIPRRELLNAPFESVKHEFAALVDVALRHGRRSQPSADQPRAPRRDRRV